MSRLVDYAKNIFWLLVFLNVVPPLLTGIKRTYGEFLTPSTKVAQLTIDAPLTDSAWYRSQLHAFFKDPEIKAILLKIESSGGSSGTAQALFQEIQELKKVYPKPIITLTENICTSGAYYIACATDCIIASPSALVGTIGARLSTIFDVKNFLEQWKINTHVITAGTYKGAGDPCATLTPEQAAMLQDIAQNIYEQFAYDVAITRKLSLKKKDEWANGKLYSGQQALNLGLIDATGSYTTAINHLKARALIENEISWVEPEHPFSMSSFIENLTDPTQKFTSPYLKLFSVLSSARSELGADVIRTVPFQGYSNTQSS